jgi:hypothetical protein
MRRFVRHFFTTVSALSLLLCLTICVLWVRSYRPVLDYVAWRGHTTWMLQSKGGRLWVEMWRGADPVPTRPAYAYPWWLLRGTTNPPYQPHTPIEMAYSIPPATWSNLFGFAWFDSGPSPKSGLWFPQQRMLLIPYWSLLGLALVIPVIMLIRSWLKGLRARRGLCPTCGYDLRATPERCPECGTPVRID